MYFFCCAIITVRSCKNEVDRNLVWSASFQDNLIMYPLKTNSASKNDRESISKSHEKMMYRWKLEKVIANNLINTQLPWWIWEDVLIRRSLPLAALCLKGPIPYHNFDLIYHV